MNKLIEKTIVEVLDAPTIRNDSTFKDLDSAKTTDEIVKAVNGAWKKTKEMYLAVGVKLFQIEQKDKAQFKEVRDKLKKSIHNGTITYLKNLGEHSEWLESRLPMLPDNLRLINDLVKDPKREENLRKLNDYSKDKDSYLPQVSVGSAQTLQALTDNKNTKQQSKKKPSRPVFLSIRASVGVWEEHQDEITSVMNDAKEKLKRKNITIYVDENKK
jgi:hypothetical protein